MTCGYIQGYRYSAITNEKIAIVSSFLIVKPEILDKKTETKLRFRQEDRPFLIFFTLTNDSKKRLKSSFPLYNILIISIKNIGDSCSLAGPRFTTQKLN